MIKAIFIGYQEIENGKKFRLYNIEGQHTKHGSTVTVRTLVEEKIEHNLSKIDLYNELNLLDEIMGR